MRAALLAALAAAALQAEPAAAQAPDARLLEAIDWYTGVAGRVDDARTRELLLAVVEETQSPLSRMWIARVHSRGRMGFSHDEELARGIARRVIDDIRALADSGEPEALFLMGTAYAEGLGADADPVEAIVWYERAAEHGHGLARHNLGNVHAEGIGVPIDSAAAVRWWTLAAEDGDAITQLRLGEAYEAGNGVAADLEEAVRWYRDAAARGNETARAALQRLGR